MNPYVFLVGCPRSGTTLLERMVNAHAKLAVVHETNWIARTFEKRRGLTEEGFITPRLLKRLRSRGRLGFLGIEERDLGWLHTAAEGAHFAQFVTRLLDRYGEQQGKPLVGDKSPGYVRHLATLQDLWPRAKFVHLLRDGHDVALSILAWSKAERNVGRFSTWREDRVATTAIFWEWNVRLGREAAGLLGAERCHELRYEALVADPERECRKLCDFLALEYDPAMLRFHEGRRRPGPGLSAKHAWLPVTPGLRRWRDQMAAGDVVSFEAAAGRLLDELGYARWATPVSGDELTRAARLREAFAAEVLARGGALPVAWRSAAA